MNRIADSEIAEHLLKIQKGQTEALSELYDLTSKHLYALCFSYMKNRADAEEALSETYLKALKHINKFNGKSAFNWLYTIAKNTCLNALKRGERVIAVDFSEEKTVNLIGAQDSGEIVLDDESGIISVAKRILSSSEFKVVILHVVCGYSFKEIAKMDGGIEATFRWRYNNALKKLRKIYEEDVL